jgi:thiol-disulfide isomerase/thioredoxin
MEYQKGSAMWLVALVVLILAGVGLYALTRPNADEAAEEAMRAALEQSEEMVQTAATSGTSTPAMGNDPTVMMDESEGTYEPYDESKLALATNGKVVLFFHAPWCPVCRALESEIQANPAGIPAGTHLLKVDYDSAVALRQKYGVTVQHTFVQVDATGEALGKWSDSTTLAGALAKIN